jgi:hypothetical protein
MNRLILVANQLPLKATRKEGATGDYEFEFDEDSLFYQAKVGGPPLLYTNTVFRVFLFTHLARRSRIILLNLVCTCCLLYVRVRTYIPYPYCSLAAKSATLVLAPIFALEVTCFLGETS